MCENALEQLYRNWNWRDWSSHESRVLFHGWLSCRIW